MYHMTGVNPGKVGGGARRCLIVVSNNWDGHVDRGGAWAPRDTSLSKAMGSEQAKMGVGGDPRGLQSKHSQVEETC
jgi:hypothetical protein